MTFEAQEIADRLGGILEGRSEIMIDCVRPPEIAGDGDLAWISDEREIPTGIAASAVLVGPSRPSEELLDVPAIIRHENPQEAFARAILLLHPEPEPPFSGISETARIHPKSKIGEDVIIGPGVYIDAHVELGGDTVGKDCPLQLAIVAEKLMRGHFRHRYGLKEGRAAVQPGELGLSQVTVPVGHGDSILRQPVVTRCRA